MSSTIRDARSFVVRAIEAMESDGGRLFVMALALFAIAFGVLLRVQTGDDFIYSIWSDRDLWRSAKLAEEFQVVGSEMGSTVAQRTPGGLFYYVVYAMMALGATPTALWLMLAVANCLVGILLYVTLRPHLGLPASLMSVGVYLVSWASLRQMMELWNPAFAMILLTIGYCLLLRMVAERRADSLPWLAALVAAAAQFHASAFVLLPIAVATVLALRIPVRRGAVLWSVAAIIVLYLPFLYDEVVHGFPWTTEVIQWRSTSSALAEGSLATQGMKLLSITLNFYRPPFANVFGGMDKTGLAVPAFGAALVAINSLVLITAYHFLTHLISLIARRRGISSGLEPGERLVVFNYLFILTVVIGFIAAGASLDERRLILLVPAGALMAGFAVTAVVGKVAALSSLWLRRAGLAIMVPILGIALWFPAYGWARLNDKDKFWPRYGTLVSMVQDFHKTLGYGAAEIRNRVALATAHPEPRFLTSRDYEAGQFAVDYLADRLLRDKPVRRDRPHPGCVAAVVLEQDGGLDPERIVAEAARGLNQGINIDRVVRGDQFVFVEYRSDDGNCPKTIVNPYVPTEMERLAARFALPIRESGAADSVAPVPLPGALAAFAIDRSNPFGPTLVALRRQEEGLVVTIDSRGLRGYRGYSSNFQLNPRLVLAEAKGEGRIVIPIREGRLGAGSALTPWHGRAGVVPSGSYRLIFQADQLSTLTRTVDNWTVILAESFALK